MNWLPVITFIAGFVLALIVAFVLKLMHVKTSDAVIDNMKASFGSLSLDALKKSTDEFLKLAKEKLESEREVNVKELNEKKGLIDLQLKNMTTKLEDASKLMKELEKDREKKFGELTEQLKTVSKQTVTLTETTGTLREALSSTKARGQWEKRITEDVLRLAGFIEKVNYVKQKAVEEGRSIPDFTFLLPNNLKLNMDVKFPLDNYMRFLEAHAESDKEKFRNGFLRDVKARVKEIKSREYINPEMNTVDYALLFIPNEQIYSFIHEQDSSILDEALKNKIIFCSPITLFAILAVIRQAVDNFSLHKDSNEILSLFGSFRKQWSVFCEQMKKVGDRITDAQRAYESLSTTRRRLLEKPLNEIENIRKQRGLPIASEDEALPFVEEAEIKDED